MNTSAFIEDLEIDRALDYLRDQSTVAAHARANRIYIEEYRKSLKAMLMKKHGDLPVNAQEREAYADPEYIEHLKALKVAVYEDERHRFLLEAATAKIDAWRTMQSNLRAMKI
jgi:hypothetical protein